MQRAGLAQQTVKVMNNKMGGLVRTRVECAGRTLVVSVRKEKNVAVRLSAGPAGFLAPRADAGGCGRSRGDEAERKNDTGGERHEDACVDRHGKVGSKWR